MGEGKHPVQFDDVLSNALLQMAEDGLVQLDGERVILTEKGRLAAQQIPTKEQS